MMVQILRKFTACVLLSSSACKNTHSSDPASVALIVSNLGPRVFARGAFPLTQASSLMFTLPKYYPPSLPPSLSLSVVYLLSFSLTTIFWLSLSRLFLSCWLSVRTIIFMLINFFLPEKGTPNDLGSLLFLCLCAVSPLPLPSFSSLLVALTQLPQ